MVLRLLLLTLALTRIDEYPVGRQRPRSRGWHHNRGWRAGLDAGLSVVTSGRRINDHIPVRLLDIIGVVGVIVWHAANPDRGIIWWQSGDQDANRGGYDHETWPIGPIPDALVIEEANAPVDDHPVAVGQFGNVSSSGRIMMVVLVVYIRGFPMMAVFLRERTLTR